MKNNIRIILAACFAVCMIVCLAVAAVRGVGDAQRNVYASVGTVGGTLTAEVTSGGKTSVKQGIVSLTSGESVTYTVTAADGYQTDYVVLNGKLTRLDNGKLTLNYDELQQDNTLSVAFVTKATAAKEKANGVTNLDGSFVTNQGNYVPDNGNANNSSADNGYAIVIVCVVVAAVLVVAAVVTVVLVRKRKAK